MSRFPSALAGSVIGLAVLVGVAWAAGDKPASPDVGRPALPAEISAWNIDVRPDGQGLPVGHGTAREGEVLFQERCAVCHGDFGEGAGRWPVLAGGQGSLRSERPEKTIGSFWPNVSTVFDYVRRAMPYGNAQSLEPNEVYAITAYLLSMNDVVTDQDQELNERNLASIRLPNEANFYDDDREKTEQAFWNKTACMKECKAGTPQVTSRARALDVTPDGTSGPKVE